MSINWRTWIPALVIILVDLATAANLYQMYAFFEIAVFAALVALAFAALQVGTLVLFTMPLPRSTRRLLFAGAAVLLAITGLSNVAMGYIHSRPIFPAQELLPALGFGSDAVSLGVVAAWVTGLALIAAAIVFWLALGQYVHQQRAREQEAIKDLDDLLGRWKGQEKGERNRA